MNAFNNNEAVQANARVGVVDAAPTPPVAMPFREAGRDNCETEIASLLARASETAVTELGDKARTHFALISGKIEDMVTSRSRKSAAIYALGYAFAVASIARPQEAALLRYWDEVRPKSGTNPYYHPVKWLCRKAVDSKSFTHTVTMLAAVYRDAHERGIEPAEFAEHLRRQGYLRTWFDSLPKGNRAKVTKKKKADPVLRHVLIRWDADQMAKAKPALAQIAGFIDILPFSPEEVAKIVSKVGNDR